MSRWTTSDWFSNGDQIPLQKRKLIRAYRNVHTLFLNALQSKTLHQNMIELCNTSTMHFGTFCNIITMDVANVFVSRTTVVRQSQRRMYHSIAWVQLSNTTWRSKQKRTEQNTIQHNTVPKEALKWRAREECARFNKNESFLWRAKVSDTLLQS
jgi:hypothetical protein